VDADFFSGYRNRFRENFLRFVDEEKSRLIGLPGINTLVDRLYVLLFSFRRDPLRDLFNISYTLAKNEIDLKKVLEKALLALLKDYIDHTISRGSDHRRVKDLVDLLDTYLSAVEDAHTAYLEELRRQVKAADSAVEESERRIALGFLEKMKEEVEILAYYKGIPVACISRILDVREEFIKVSTCRMDAMRVEEHVYIKHSNLPKPIEASVVEKDTGRDEATLEVLGFRDLPQERRRYLRVIPKEPVKVFLSKEGWTAEGTMADISVGGVGVYIEDPGDLKKEDTVSVRFSLPKGDVETQASVRYVLDRGKLFKVGLQYSLDVHTEDVVSDYVMERQFEILRELKGLDD